MTFNEVEPATQRGVKIAIAPDSSSLLVINAIYYKQQRFPFMRLQ